MINISEVLSSIGMTAFRDFYDSSVEYYDSNGKRINIDEWCVFTLVSEDVETYADNFDIYTSIEWYVNYYHESLDKVNQMKVKIRDVLRKAGFTIRQTQVLYENDVKLYHLVIDIQEITETETEAI